MNLKIAKVLAALGIAGVMTLCAGTGPTNLISFKPYNGIAYSPFRGNQSPDYYTYPSVADVTDDITNKLIYLASEISTYGMAGSQFNIASICNTYHLPCYPCAFLNVTNSYDNSNELNALILVGNQNYPTTRGLVVGSESIWAGYNANTLIENINYVRSATHGTVPVGTREPPASFMNNPALAAACDFIQADIHPYWGEMPVSDGVAYTIQQWQMLTNQFPNTKVEIGETGWPTGGTNAWWSNSSVVPSVENQGMYLGEFVYTARQMGIEYFIFEFRDESWKEQEGIGNVETNWGIYYGTNQLYGADQKKLSLIDYQQYGFSLNISKINATNAQITMPTFESDPYWIVATPNLLTGPWTPYPFTSAAGTNQTTLTIPIFNGQVNWFYFASQQF